MIDAIKSLITFTRIDDSVIPGHSSALLTSQAFIEHQADYQLYLPSSVYLTFGELYEQLQNDPELADSKLSLNTDEFLEILNSRIIEAFAAPNSVRNSRIVLLATQPGRIGATPPTITSSTQISPAQALLLPVLRIELWLDGHRASFGATIPDPECVKACEEEHERAIGLADAQLSMDLQQAQQAYNNCMKERGVILVKFWLCPAWRDADINAARAKHRASVAAADAALDACIAGCPHKHAQGGA